MGIGQPERFLQRWLHVWLYTGIRLLLMFFPQARRNRPVRASLWSGAPIINMAVNARAEARLGIVADSLVYFTYYITDAFTYDLSRWMKNRLLRFLLSYLVLFWACLKYQRFHFYCDRGLLYGFQPFCINEDELKLLRLLGKEIYFWTYGADVRTRKRTQTLGVYHCCLECPFPGQACICDDKLGQDNYRVACRYATAVFAMGDMQEYTLGSRNDLFFWPVDLAADGGRRYAPCFPTTDRQNPLRIVHAPNHRHYKGTRFLIEAVERLQAQGVDILLELVEGVPNSQALEIYRSADVVFDQCLIGFHGYLLLEAFALGKPVMCYIRDPQRYLLHGEQMPLINCRADGVEAALKQLVQNRPQLQAQGIAARRYIETYHSMDAFAARLARAYSETKTKEQQ